MGAGTPSALKEAEQEQTAQFTDGGVWKDY